jgi:hypothetical protein
MKRPHLFIALAATLALACRPAPARPQPSAPAPAAGEPAAALPAPALLDRMDRRISVPLLPMMAHHQKENMRDHLLAVQQVVLALASDDLPAVASAAGRIGLSPEMGRMCSHMGAGAPGFTEQALQFHRTADGIADAARKRDRKAVLTALGATLQTCTGCHATFKQTVVDQATWSRLTARHAPAGGH